MNTNHHRLLELFWSFLKIGAFTFGGGYAMISMVEIEVVDRKKWITEKQYMDMIAISQATPGVIAVNTATYVGYAVGGFWGSVLATLGVTIPSFVIIVIISFFLDAFLALKWVSYAFMGIRAGVIVLIFDAVMRMRKTLSVNTFTMIVLLISFLVATFTSLSVIWIILAGAVLGIIWQIGITHAYDKKDDATKSDGGVQ
ncbi:MAG: chromate transporter [Eubacteriaceae bacterium]|jgi:chromate transporter